MLNTSASEAGFVPDRLSPPVAVKVGHPRCGRFTLEGFDAVDSFDMCEGQIVTVSSAASVSIRDVG